MHDPEIGRPLAELGMLGEVTTHRGHVRVEVRLTTESCPLVDELRHAVTTVVSVQAGVRDVEVAFTSMAPRERAEFADRLKLAAPPLNATLGIGGTRVYAIASGKGGVGKSTVTANLAVALAAQGKRVGVLDADVWGYSMPQLFGVRRNPVVLGELMMPVPGPRRRADVDRLLRQRGAAGRLARADAAQGPAAVRHRHLLGQARRAARRHAARVPATPRSRCWSSSPTRRCSR